MLTKNQIKDNEIKFQEAQRIYFISKNSLVLHRENKPSWDHMYMYVNMCVSNIAKSKMKGIYINDLDGKITDAVIKIMYKIKNGTMIKKLSSFCYLYVIGELYNRKIKQEDKTISLDYYSYKIRAKEELQH
jgi:hypothetical protein